MRFTDTICGGCGRWSVLCDMDPLCSEDCTCPNIDELPANWQWWLELYDAGNPT